MRYLSVTVACFVAACLVAPLAAAQTEEPAPAPRTAWGQPDLGGVWEYKTRTPLERPEQYAGREYLTEEEAAEIEQRERARIQAMEERPAQRTIAIPTAPDGGSTRRITPACRGRPGRTTSSGSTGGRPPSARGARRSSSILRTAGCPR